MPPLPFRADCVNPRARSARRTDMADHHEVEYATAAGNDYAEHEGTYRFFVKLVKWHIIVIVIILLLMAYFLV
jgi:hypothetical protein